MSYSERQRWVRYAWPVAGVGFVTLLYKLFVTEVNVTTVALSFLLVVLTVASAYGLAPGIMASVLGMLCFNFFFLPPHGTLIINDPQNWAALFAFLVTAVITSQLSSTARSRARDAEKRREEVLKLYELSRAINVTPDSETAISSIARQVVEIFGVSHCEVFVPVETGSWSRLATANALGNQSSLASSLDTIGQAFRAGEVRLSDEPRAIAYAPLKVGVRSIGVMVLDAETVERGTVEAIAGLVALALERARFLKEMSRAEALRQSDELKSAILASVSHDLRTPLTSIRASVDNLLQSDLGWDKATLREFHLIISEEVDRLTRLVQNLLEMARIEAGELHPAKEWCSVSEIFANVLERCALYLKGHRVRNLHDTDLPAVKLDPRLIAEALSNPVENAAKYSPGGSEILLDARLRGDELIISVTDEGQGVAPDEAHRVFDKFYRGTRFVKRPASGTGMGLAIARGIIEAHAGKIWVESPRGRGATFAFAIPTGQRRAVETLAAGEGNL